MIYFSNSTKEFLLTDEVLPYDIEVASDGEAETWGEYCPCLTYNSMEGGVIFFSHRYSVCKLKEWLILNKYPVDFNFLINDNLFALGTTEDGSRTAQHGSKLFMFYLKKLRLSSDNTFLTYNSAGDYRYTNQPYKALTKLGLVKFERLGEQARTSISTTTIGTSKFNRANYYMNILNVEKKADVVIAVVNNILEFKRAVELARKAYIIVHPSGLPVPNTRIKGIYERFTVTAEATYRIHPFSTNVKGKGYDSRLQNDERLQNDNYREDKSVQPDRQHLTLEDIGYLKQLEKVLGL